MTAAVPGCAGSSPGSGSSTCIAPVANLFGKGHGPVFIAGGVLLAVAFCVLYIGILCTWERYPQRALAGLAVIAALAVIACLVYGSDWTSMWIYVSAAIGFVFPGRRRAMAGGRRVRCLLRPAGLGGPRAGERLPGRAAARGAGRLGHDRLPAAACPHVRAAPGAGNGGQAGRERGAAPAGPRHARPDRPVAVPHHAEVRAGRAAARPAAAVRRAGRGAKRDHRHRPGQPPDPAGHQGSRQRLPAADARRGDHHGPHVAGGRGHPRRRRPGPDHAFGHLRPGCRGGPGLVPARGGHQRDPPLRRAELPGPPDGTVG